MGIENQASQSRNRRIQDAVHGLIEFDNENATDQVAWQLVQTSDFQRLRRIKQLGFAEFVFPSATQSRFAHSIGVFHCARRLVKRIRCEQETKGNYDKKRAETAVVAALLHDIGHGPFSHAFKSVRQKLSGTERGNKFKSHEQYSAQMVKSGEIGRILASGDFDSAEIAKMISDETPEDMYHAIVSGTFDADRMDYMMRDRYMAGIGMGGFDTNWIMDNVRVSDSSGKPTLCLAYKALTAAEDFLLTRYHLHKDIYSHKTTRAMECLFEAFLIRFAEEGRKDSNEYGLDETHPLWRFFVQGKHGLKTYRELDDTIVWNTLRYFSKRGRTRSPTSLGAIAKRIIERDIPDCIEVTKRFPMQTEMQQALKNAIESKFRKSFGKTVFFNSSTISRYASVADRDWHKGFWIQLPDNKLEQIDEFPNSIFKNLSTKGVCLERYYFLSKNEHKAAEEIANNL